MARQDPPRAPHVPAHAQHVPLVDLATRSAGGHKLPVTAVGWSCDGKFLLAGGDNSFLRAYDNDLLAQRDISADRDSTVFKGHLNAVDIIVAAPHNSGLFAAANSRSNCTLRLYNIRATNRGPVWVLTLGAAAVCSVAWSPDGKWIVVGDSAGDVHVVNAEKGEVVRGAIKKQARYLALASGGRLMFLARGDGRVEVATWPKMEHFTYLVGHRGPVLCLAVDPKGRRLAASSNDNLVSVWNARTLSCEAMIDRAAAPALHMDYSFDGKYLATDVSPLPTPGIEISEAETGTRVVFIATTGTVRDLKWHPKRLLLAYCVAYKPWDGSKLPPRPQQPSRSNMYPAAPPDTSHTKAYVYDLTKAWEANFTEPPPPRQGHR